MCRLASHWKTKQQVSGGFEDFDSLCTTLMDCSSWVAKALISAPPICWKGVNLERRERQELEIVIEETNKDACLHV